MFFLIKYFRNALKSMRFFLSNLLNFPNKLLKLILLLGLRSFVGGKVNYINILLLKIVCIFPPSRPVTFPAAFNTIEYC